MAMSLGQSDSMLGGWAAFDDINSVDDVRSKLAVMREFKEDIDIGQKTVSWVYNVKLIKIEEYEIGDDKYFKN
ncbi:MAG TPA: hypothetical protein VK071_11655 [Tissierellales bacterium]|nr:hypothetical protein [Tissierellales bacterium]